MIITVEAGGITSVCFSFALEAGFSLDIADNSDYLKPV